MSKNKIKRLLGYLLMLFALSIPLYTFGRMVLQSFAQERGYTNFLQKTSTESYAETLEKSLAYNQRLASGNHIVDPFLAEEYRVNYQVTDDYDAVYGYLSIPTLEVMEPVYLGADYHHLGIGLAHVDGTPLPVEGAGIRSVIAGHRAEPSHIFFRHLDKLEPGDRLYYDNGQEIVEYKMVDSEIILPSEWEKLSPTSDKNMLTLITCDPIPSFNKRLLVNFERIGIYPKTATDRAAIETTAFTKKGQSISRVATFQWFYRGVVALASIGLMFVLWKMIRFLMSK